MRVPLSLLAAVVFLPVLADCGSTVPEAGGGGGAAGAGGNMGDGGGSACKSFPSPHGYLISCGSAQAGGGDTPVSCAECKSDQGDNKYRADCVGPACTCTYAPGDGSPEVGCSCTMSAACKVTFPTCCPQLD